MINEGVIILNKPAGYTSHDCVAIVRKWTGIKRVGHTGTLDPQATGVLTVCIGSAARITEYLDFDYKTYRCEIEFGRMTDTYDVWGADLPLDEKHSAAILELTEDKIREVLKSFKGHILQVPPKYSALKVNGKKLYEYARSGQDVDIKARNVDIAELEIDSIDLCNRKAVFTIKCSKGTYIRSICHDAGRLLGCGAVMSGLVRLESGACKIEDSISLDDLKNTKDLNAVIRRADFALQNMGKIEIPPYRSGWFLNGGALRPDEVEILEEPKIPEQDDFYCVYCNDDFLGVVIMKNGIYKPDKIFSKRTRSIRDENF